MCLYCTVIKALGTLVANAAFGGMITSIAGCDMLRVFTSHALYLIKERYDYTPSGEP